MRFIHILALLALFSAPAISQRTSSGSRSYGGSSSFSGSSRSYSSSPSRSYSSGSNSTFRSQSSASQPSTSSRTYSDKLFGQNPSRPSASSRTYSGAAATPPTSASRPSASSRTYASTPAAPRSYTYRTYVYHDYSRAPVFISHGYYDTWAGYDGIPWWGWMAIWHSSSYRAPVMMNGAVAYQPVPVTTAFNWIGAIIWLAVLGVIGLTAWALIWRPATTRVYRHY